MTVLPKNFSTAVREFVFVHFLSTPKEAGRNQYTFEFLHPERGMVTSPHASFPQPNGELNSKEDHL
jgi:hypothetical protein